ncbi:hypothetical protein E1K68_03885 [Pseudomonas sp. B2021]|nr:hypothetical protein [Pseudomonas sp. B2021]TKJ94782.1 hypothetical protein PflCFBP13510_28980 [Pseudomonas fluorescens]
MNAQTIERGAGQVGAGLPAMQATRSSSWNEVMLSQASQLPQCSASPGALRPFYKIGKRPFSSILKPTTATPNHTRPFYLSPSIRLNTRLIV